MRKSICFWAITLMAALWLCGAGAEGTVCRIEGDTSGGVTFLVSQASCDGKRVQITVEQRPNDPLTALMDNQVEYPRGDPDFVREKREAAQYGGQILGTLCDLWSIEGAGLPSLPSEYEVSCRREGGGLVYTFTFDLPDTYVGGAVRVTLALGVNEDLSCRFPNFQRVEIIVSRDTSGALLPKAAADPDDLAGDEIRVLAGQP